ncbi:MAG TPA: methyltransferase domain-containing protein [Candidatus Binataceae bacterium]
MAHKDLVREEFTRQADTYASSPAITNLDRIQKLIEQAAPRPEDRVLEVATGPGHVALAFAKACREVVGVDLTQAPLEIAERMRGERGIANARFKLADADRLPFADGEFDVVFCRFAVHHFDQPKKVFAEMSRVCRTDGTVVVEDLISSEHPARAEYYNRFERLRDTSHTRALPLSELVATLAQAGLELVRFSSDGYRNPVEPWLASAQTPLDRAAEARAMIERDLREDLSGARPARINGELFFSYRLATVVTRKLRSRS